MIPNRFVVIAGVLSCIIIGILSLIVLTMWIHVKITSKCKPERTNNVMLYYMTLFVSLLYSLHVISSLVASIFQLILKQYNKSNVLNFYILYPVYLLSVYGMLALYVLRLDLTFRGTYFELKRNTIRILWFIYACPMLMLSCGFMTFYFHANIIGLILCLLAVVLLLSFIIILFRMFTNKLKQICGSNDKKGTQYIRDLVLKLNIIVHFSLLTTFTSWISTLLIISPQYSKYTGILYFVFNVIFAFDACMCTCV